MSLDYSTLLYSYHYWANERVLQTAEQAPPPCWTRQAGAAIPVSLTSWRIQSARSGYGARAGRACRSRSVPRRLNSRRWPPADCPATAALRDSNKGTARVVRWTARRRALLLPADHGYSPVLAVWLIRPPKRAGDRSRLLSLRSSASGLGSLPRTPHRSCPMVLYGLSFWGRMNEAASTGPPAYRSRAKR